MHPYKKFLFHNILMTLITALFGGLLFYTVFKDYFHPVFPFLLLYALTINLLAFYIVSRKKISGSQTMLLVVKLFALKFFSYLVPTVVFVLLVNETVYRVAFVALLFALYLAFTTLEVVSLVNYLNRESRDNSP